MVNELVCAERRELRGRVEKRTSSVGERNLYSWIKALAEFCLASALLVVTLPLILAAIVAVKMTSRGPAIYAQLRSGRNGRPFFVLKIRSMTHNCEAQSGICWSTKGDPRVTPVGRFLRASHIDELPQLWNVLRGDMSLVGPRPERPEFVTTLKKVVQRYGERLSVRPGLTGLAQIQLPPDTDVESVRRKIAHDLYYLENLSFWLDVRLLTATLFLILGIPYSIRRALLALPEREKVERIYRLSIRVKSDDGDFKEASSPILNGNPVVSLEPA